MFAPLPDAVRRISSRTPLGSAMRTRDWETLVPAEIRDQAVFSAGVESARVLEAMQRKLTQAISHERQSLDEGGVLVSRDEFVSKMKGALAEEGLGTGAGGLTDISSAQRLRLIYDTQVDRAHSYARHVAGQDPDILDAYPAQELIRIETREKPRDWTQRWSAAGGVIRGGRMVALKSDPIWAKLSRFGQPFPPFDFGSGMGVEDLSRGEAEDLGLIKPGEDPKPAPNTGMGEPEVAALPEATVKRLRNLFGDQMLEVDGKLRLERDPIGKLYERATAQGSGKEDLAVNLGDAWPSTLKTISDGIGVDARGYTLQVRASEVAHALKGHGPRDLMFPGSGEKRPDQEPLTIDDLREIPAIWRSPEAAIPGSKAPAQAQPSDGWPPSIRLGRKSGGYLWLAAFEPDKRTRTLRAVSMWKKKLSGAGGTLPMPQGGTP